MSIVQVHVDSLEDMGKRIASVWKRAEAGEQVDDQHVTFFNLEALLDTPVPQAAGATERCAAVPSSIRRLLGTALGQGLQARP